MSRGGRVARTALTTVALVLVASACGSSSSDDPSVVRWYVAAGDVGSTALAETCEPSLGEDLSLEVVELPADPDALHTTLVRRLDADPSSVDLMTLDGALVPELGTAGFLAPVPSAARTALADGVLPQALEQTVVDDRMVAAPWLFDPQLLWFRNVTAERAGLDVTKPIAWADLISGARRLGVSVQMTDDLGSGLVDWVSALVASSGGTLLQGAGPDAKVGLGGAPGRQAAALVQQVAESGVGPGPDAAAVEAFAGIDGGFLLAPGTAYTDPSLTALQPELGVVQYPRVGETEAVPPARGTVLAVSAGSRHRSEVFDLVQCLAADETVASIVLSTGHAPARPAVLADRSVRSALPFARTLAAAQKAARPAPVTPYWTAVRRAVVDTWSPISGVTTDRTPTDSQAAVRAALRGELP